MKVCANLKDSTPLILWWPDLRRDSDDGRNSPVDNRTRRSHELQ